MKVVYQASSWERNLWVKVLLKNDKSYYTSRAISMSSLSELKQANKFDNAFYKEVIISTKETRSHKWDVMSKIMDGCLQGEKKNQENFQEMEGKI